MDDGALGMPLGYGLSNSSEGAYISAHILGKGCILDSQWVAALEAYRSLCSCEMVLKRRGIIIHEQSVTRIPMLRFHFNMC